MFTNNSFNLSELPIDGDESDVYDIDNEDGLNASPINVNSNINLYANINVHENIISPTPINPIPLISSSISTNFSRKFNLSPPRIRSRSASFSKQQKEDNNMVYLSPTTGINDENVNSHVYPFASSRVNQNFNSNKSSSIYSNNWAVERLLSMFEYFLKPEDESEDEDEDEDGENEYDEYKDDNRDLKEKQSLDKSKARSSRIIKKKDSSYTHTYFHLHVNSHKHSHPYSSIFISVILILSLLFISICAFSFLTTTPDTKICRLPYMNESYRKFPDFNSSITPLASKYSLLLYREQNIDPVDNLNGAPVIFIPGNAGSYRQVRSLAAEAAHQFNALKNDFHEDNDKHGLDFFTTDFGEDLTAFHGKSLIEQAEYLNEAIKFILSLYQNDPHYHSKNIYKKGILTVPYPKSVILIGHSMGGMVARTMFTLPNYTPDSINTVMTFAAPHSLPPVSSDPYLVEIYESVNKYWRDSFSQDSIGQNSLADVSVISIAGGSLDQMIPSDHASISSMVPPNHGLTVFTSTIPFVWSGIDHQAIIWCDQLRKVVAKSLLDIIDGRLQTKTKPVYERMKIFRKYFLTGLEDNKVESIDESNSDTLLLFDNDNSIFIANNEKLNIEIGKSTNNYSPAIYLLPIPLNRQFSLLTDQKLLSPRKFSIVNDNDNNDNNDFENGIYVLACKYLSTDLTGSLLSTLDISENNDPNSFICKNMASFATYLPAADRNIATIPLAPPDPEDYSSFIYYNTSHLSNYDFITIINTNYGSSTGYLVSNIEKKSEVLVEIEDNLMFALKGKTIQIPSKPIITDISFKTIWSSLLTYVLVVKETGDSISFHPFLRQYVDDPHESKFYLNLLPDTKLNINIHSIAPFSPFNHKTVDNYHNLHFQIWSDSDSDLQIHLQLDIIASLGKLVLHYRVALAYLPVCIICLVFLLQLHIYNLTGFFISFSDGLKIFTVKYFLWLLILVALLPIIITIPFVDKLFYLIEPSMDPSTGEGPVTVFFLARKNQFFLGLEKGHLWVLGPLFILVAVGITHATDCIVSIFINFFAHLTKLIINDDSRWIYKLFNRISMVILVGCTSIIFPYQLSFIILCILQFISAINQQSHNKKYYEPSSSNQNLLHITITLLLLMIWIAPTNLTTLAVYVHNLKFKWEMPIHSFENLLSILPILLLCERINDDNMIPKMTRSTQRLLTYCMIIYICGYSLIFGMQRMYWIYHLVNFFCGWIWVCYGEYDDN